MKVSKLYPYLFLLLTILFFSCEKGGNETKISRHNDEESHNMGKNCMDCHKKGGSGAGWFKVAGTVYDTTFSFLYPNASIKLYTQQYGGGDIVKNIEVDGNGNFYTTESVDFSAGLYPAVTGTTEKTLYMVNPATTGACNSCHNYTNCKISTR
jgi:hypothetical protein